MRRVVRYEAKGLTDRAHRRGDDSYEKGRIVPFSDIPLEDLRTYCPQVAEPAGFDAFWESTLTSAYSFSQHATAKPVAGPIEELIVEDLEFRGFGGEPIRAWIIRPHDRDHLPAIIEFAGYGRGRGAAAEHLHWASCGYAHVVMDTRGQGSGWGSAPGVTPDNHGSGPSLGGFVTRGIDSPENYYYRRVFADAVRLVDVVADLPYVDEQRVCVSGESQGGGIAIAAASLSGSKVAAVMPDVPFLCHFRRSVELETGIPYNEVADYLSIHRGEVAQTFATLSYFDAVNFAKRARVPALFSVGLRDETVHPSTVFTAFNSWAGSNKAISVYEFNGHEGGQLYHWLKQVEWLNNLWKDRA
ncbi:acetylxylan esterase [Changpingibacter yushuensis]|uniref:acetylxylan esterase n=1 Tax=Changpingibacter yushuensis TaxID=2758440 RepID=UPI001FE9AC9B|nr:acetylxylan esterase [Changpingibacter yushuensis]